MTMLESHWTLQFILSHSQFYAKELKMNEQWLEKAISTLEGYTNPIKDRYQEFTFSSMRLLYENNVRIFESFLIKSRQSLTRLKSIYEDAYILREDLEFFCNRTKKEKDKYKKIVEEVEHKIVEVEIQIDQQVGRQFITELLLKDKEELQKELLSVKEKNLKFQVRANQLFDEILLRGNQITHQSYQYFTFQPGNKYLQSSHKSIELSKFRSSEDENLLKKVEMENQICQSIESLDRIKFPFTREANLLAESIYIDSNNLEKTD